MARRALFARRRARQVRHVGLRHELRGRQVSCMIVLCFSCLGCWVLFLVWLALTRTIMHAAGSHKSCV